VGQVALLRELEGSRPAAEAAAAQRILDWARGCVTRIWWGKGQRTGSFVPVLEHKGTSYQLFAVYTYGTVETYFQFYLLKQPFDAEEKRLDLLRRLNAIDGISIPASAITRRPGIPLSALVDEQNLSGFLRAYEWFIEQVRLT
jgi:hypothetical protein